MAMKILVVKGSPRKQGNSSILADELAESARKTGAEVATIRLHGLSIAPCRGCEHCHQVKVGECVTKDDMQSLYPKVLEAQAIVYAGPIYWFTISAQLKLFIDRCYSLNAASDSDPEAPSFLAGKKIVGLFTYGDDDPLTSGVANAAGMLRDMCRYAGAELVGIAHGTAGAAGEVRENAALLERVRELGKTLAAFGRRAGGRGRTR